MEDFAALNLDGEDMDYLQEVPSSVGPAPCEEVPSGLKVHNWSISFRDEVVYGQLIIFQNSVLIWLGFEPAKMGNLSVTLMAMGQPSGTTIIGSNDDFAQRLGQKVVKSFSLVAFVSYNIPDDRVYLEPIVEKSLFAELAAQLPKR